MNILIGTRGACDSVVVREDTSSVGGILNVYAGISC